MNLGDLPPDVRRDVLRRVKAQTRDAAPGARATGVSRLRATNPGVPEGDRSTINTHSAKRGRTVISEQGWRCHRCGERFEGHGAQVGLERHSDATGHRRYECLIELAT